METAHDAVWGTVTLTISVHAETVNIVQMPKQPYSEAESLMFWDRHTHTNQSKGKDSGSCYSKYRLIHLLLKLQKLTN